jgi:HlyD family secretion protein
MKKRKIILPVLVLLAVALPAMYFVFDRSGVHDGEIITSGHIEVTEVDMSFRLPGHVARLLVDEGAQVKKGDVLAELDQEPIRARRDQASASVRELEAKIASLSLAIDIKQGVLGAEVKKAQAGVSAADARYQSLRTGSREEEIAEAAAARDKARTEWENRVVDFKRIEDLYERKIVPARQYDDALAGTEASRAAFLAAEERYKLVKAGPRKEAILEGKANLAGSDAALSAAEAGSQEVEKMRLDLKALHAQMDRARAALAIAEDDLSKSTLHAPFNAFVTAKDTEEKEFVQPGTPVVTIADLDEVWVKTYVPETQLGRVRLGQEAEVQSDTFPGKPYHGKVTFISPEAEFTPKNVQTKEERVKLVYRIKVTLRNPNQELKAGMPVDVILR